MRFSPQAPKVVLQFVTKGKHGRKTWEKHEIFGRKMWEKHEIFGRKMWEKREIFG